MARPLHKLSASQVKAASPGKYNDGAGLWLHKRSDGGGQWFLRVTVHGRRREMGLGSITEVSLKEARQSVEKGELIAQPTDANLQKLWGRTSLEEQRVHAKLAEANIESSDSLRISGLQDYLRLESLVRGWINAFKFCGPQIICVEDELEWNLYMICKTYEITPKELKPLKDASTVVNINWYSGK